MLKSVEIKVKFIMLELNSLLILMVVVWIAGKVFRKLGLPVIFGELMAGLIVGPVLLGVVEETETITILAELGIFFLMLHTGLESDPREIFGNSKKSLVIALGGVIVPFVLGYFISIPFGLSNAAALFVAMSLSVTAIAVSARLFQDNNMADSEVAKITMAASLFNDVMALVMFSLIIDVAKTGFVDPAALVFLVFKVLAYFAVVLFVGQKFFPQINKIIYSGNKGFTFTLIIALLFGLIAEWIGLHIIIGAFLAGLFIREEVIEDELFAKIEDRIWGFSYSFLGPIFFASLAFHLDFTSVFSDPWFLIVVVLIALIGKFVGVYLPARFLKYSKSDSLIMGVAMNGRGAVDLILASIGYNLGVIDETVFSVIVLMAFLTTLFSVLGMKPVVKRLSK